MSEAYDELYPDWKVDPWKDRDKLLSNNLVLGDREYILLKLIRSEPGLSREELASEVERISGKKCSVGWVKNEVLELRKSENQEIKGVIERHDRWSSAMQHQYQMVVDHPGLTENEYSIYLGISEATVDSRMVNLNNLSENPAEGLLREDMERHKRWRDLGVGIFAYYLEQNPLTTVEGLADKLGIDLEKALQKYSKFKELAQTDYVAGFIYEKHRAALREEGLDQLDKAGLREVYLLLRDNPGMTQKELARLFSARRAGETLRWQGVSDISDVKYDLFRRVYRKFERFAETNTDAANLSNFL
jgi:DNA-binding XRE family transcriptional regulator